MNSFYSGRVYDGSHLPEAKLTEGMKPLAWPSKKPALKVIPATEHRSEYKERRGSFTREPLSEAEKAERDRKYLKRRRRCAMSELYTCMKRLEDARGQVRERAYQSCVKARVALERLGADTWLKVRMRP